MGAGRSQYTKSGSADSRRSGATWLGIDQRKKANRSSCRRECETKKVAGLFALTMRTKSLRFYVVWQHKAATVFQGSPVSGHTTHVTPSSFRSARLRRSPAYLTRLEAPPRALRVSARVDA